VANIVMDPTWIPSIQHVQFSGDGVFHANVLWEELGAKAAIEKVTPVA